MFAVVIRWREKRRERGRDKHEGARERERGIVYVRV